MTREGDESTFGESEPSEIGMVDLGIIAMAKF
jgi:hypothetical protein